MTIKNNNLICSNYDCSLDENFIDNKILEDVSYLVDNKYSLFKLKKLFSKNDDEIFYFLTSEIVEPLSFSGKPIELLIGIDKFCTIKDIKLLKHSEPIILLGIPLIELLNSVFSYKNKSIKDSLIILGNADCNYFVNEDKNVNIEKEKFNISVISRATVTSIGLHSTILNSVYRVSLDLKFLTENIKLKNKDEKFLSDIYIKYNWDELLKYNLVKNFKFFDKNLNNLVLDIFFADITPPSIGINLFGEKFFTYLYSLLDKDDSIIFIINRGNWSFKGSGWVRGGLFDRFHLKQHNKIIMFHDYDYLSIPSFVDSSVPEYKEGGLFIIRNKVFYNPVKEWSLIFLYNTLSQSLNSEHNDSNGYFFSIPVLYEVPKILCQELISSTELSKKFIFFIKNFFFSNVNILYCIFYSILWISVYCLFIFKKFFFFYIQKKKFDFIYLFTLCLSLFSFGYVFHAQISIVNLFTIINVLQQKVTIKVLFMDPFFLFGWFFLILSLILWGRSAFCGFLCPFGILQEFIYRINELFMIPVNKLINNFLYFFNKQVLRTVRWILFVFLGVIYFYNFDYAEIFSEIEPFKTCWSIGILERGFFGFYLIFLLFLSFFFYRFFCRYLCFLGSFLALCSIFSIFKLPRRNACSTCRICRNICKVTAINFENGLIDSKKCIGCLECMLVMYDVKVCPALIKKFI